MKKLIKAYIDGTKIYQVMPDIHPLYQFKKQTVVNYDVVEYQCNYIYVAGESQLIILN